MTVAAISQHTGSRLAAVGFLLVVFAGIWVPAAQIPRLKVAAGRVHQDPPASISGSVLRRPALPGPLFLQTDERQNRAVVVF